MKKLIITLIILSFSTICYAGDYDFMRPLEDFQQDQERQRQREQERQDVIREQQDREIERQRENYRDMERHRERTKQDLLGW